MAKRCFLGPKWWNQALGFKPFPVSFLLSSPFPRIHPQMPGSLPPRPESHSFFIKRNHFPHYTWNHWPDDADTQGQICITVQYWNYHRTVSEIIFPPKSSDLWAFSPTSCSTPHYKSPISFILVLSEGKLGHFVTLYPPRVFFGSVGGWTHIGFSVHLLHRRKTHHSVRLQHFLGR